MLDEEELALFQDRHVLYLLWLSFPSYHPWLLLEGMKKDVGIFEYENGVYLNSFRCSNITQGTSKWYRIQASRFTRFEKFQWTMMMIKWTTLLRLWTTIFLSSSRALADLLFRQWPKPSIESSVGQQTCYCKTTSNNNKKDNKNDNIKSIIILIKVIINRLIRIIGWELIYHK